MKEDLQIEDIERCPCCNVPRDEWDYCDLCRVQEKVEDE